MLSIVVNHKAFSGGGPFRQRRSEIEGLSKLLRLTLGAYHDSLIISIFLLVSDPRMTL